MDTTLAEPKVSAGNGSGESSCAAVPPSAVPTSPRGGRFLPGAAPSPKPRVFPLPPPASLLDFVEGLQPFRLAMSSKLKEIIRYLLNAEPRVCFQGCLSRLVAPLLSPLLLPSSLVVGFEPGQCPICTAPCCVSVQMSQLRHSGAPSPSASHAHGAWGRCQVTLRR